MELRVRVQFERPTQAVCALLPRGRQTRHDTQFVVQRGQSGKDEAASSQHARHSFLNSPYQTDGTGLQLGPSSVAAASHIAAMRSSERDPVGFISNPRTRPILASGRAYGVRYAYS